MEDVPTSTSVTYTDFASSSISKYGDLIDIPITARVVDSLISLFNYFDIYAQRIPLIYSVVTCIRFFQLIGGAFFSANTDSFLPGTFSYKVMSLITVLFHIVPLQYRLGKAAIILYSINSVLVIFVVHLLITAYIYKKTSKVSNYSCIILSIFNSIGPYTLIPIVAQYSGQTLSAIIQGTVKPNPKDLMALVISFANIFLFNWINIKAYSISLVFRMCSFQSIEGSPQNKLFITTTFVTLVAALTTYFTAIPSAAMISISILFFIYCTTTVFNCGTFIKQKHQVMVLGGSILGIELCIANLIIIFLKKPWDASFFLGFGVAAVITFVLTELFIKRKNRRELQILDEIEDTKDISSIRNKNKFKQLLATGFTFSHPICINFTVFKLAVEQWKMDCDVWSVYAKFISIYPENVGTLCFIAQNIANLKLNTNLSNIILNSAGYILRTRETKFTPQLKTRISKLSKNFNKTKTRLRNIWDLVLQGNINELNFAIKRTKESVDDCERDIDHLVMTYPNNRFVARQKLIFLSEVKGDPVNAKQSIDEIVKLQRGISKREDTIHELGMMAFPNIPDYCNDSMSIGKTINENESTTNDETVFDDTVNFEAIESISKQIDNHRVPAIQYIYKSAWICFILLIFLPLVSMIVVYQFYQTAYSRPIYMMQGIAKTRNIITMLTAFAGRFLFQVLDDPKNPGHKLMGPLDLLPNFNMDSYGNNKQTQAIMKYIAAKVSSSTELMTDIISYKPNNLYMENVRKLLFENNIKFFFFLNNTFWEESKTTATEISYIISNHVGKLLDMNYYDAGVANGPDSLIIRNNNNYPTTAMNEALKSMISYLIALNENYQKIFIIVLIVIICINIIIYPIVYYTQIRRLRDNRYEVLQLMTTLPKTVISGISASLNKIKDEKTVTQTMSITNTSSNPNYEQNRQEESIIKLFTSISDGTSKASIETSILILMIIIVGLSCVSYYLGMNCFMVSSNNLLFNCHHINYLFGSVTYLFGVCARIFKVSLATCDESFKDSILSIDDEIQNIKRILPFLVNYFQFIRLGGEDRREIPFSEMGKTISTASELLTCTVGLNPPKTVMESVHCLTSAMQFIVSTDLMKKFYNNMLYKIYPDPRDLSLQQLWQIGPIELYQTFFYPAEEKLIPIIVDNLHNEGDKLIQYNVIFIILTLILTIIICAIAYNEDKLLKFTLKLFMRCPPTTILNNQRIMDLISGHYNYKNDDNSEKHVWLTNEVVNRLNDVVIVCQEETSKIITVNAAFQELFNIKQEDIENTQIKDFFTEERFKCDEKIDRVFTKTTNLVYLNKSGNKVYLEFSTSVISGRRIYSGRDQTQNVMHEKLIIEEKKKSDAMLSSILPPMLVPRVQAGEKNISFSVQSATVLFLDVVEFTPWCGSHDAQYVMRMLNIMFKEFDAITNAHKTMTKIKCIGDCYMAVGGIFDEVNQPAVHAKEVVDFGTLVIKKLLEIDERENENLRIRVGVNTGGPVVAGVIGTEKPTFEILGPAINIAHEMENKGVPMKVHISRPVYELIYGQNFDIKERGEIDVKGGKMFTYIVEP